MIVVGVDYSEGSAAAVEVARKLARQRNTMIRFVHVSSGREDEGSGARRWTWLRSLSIEPKQIESRTGVPWVELVRAAEEEGASFVVAGTHGEAGFQPLRLGSTATHVALRSSAPVILVPPRRDGTGTGSRKEGETMRYVKKVLVLAVAAAATLSIAACGKKPEPVTPAPVNDSANRDAEERARREAEERARREAEARAAEEAARREAERKRTVLEEMVFFDYDQSAIRADARATLDAKARVLRDDAAIRLRITGHADERGSTEYNLALGLRRAQSIKDYLAGYGVSAERMEVQSMGEERPLATGRDEASWSRNRRGEFSILAGLRAGN